MSKKKIIVSLLIAGGFISPVAHATNGMNLEGYGPIAAAMGGASMAYDNGTAAVMNNPATLGLMETDARFDVALGLLAPSITSKVPGASADSSATAFYMPAMGYARKSGKLTYGVGIFSQGGMGTEYASNSFMAAGSGMPVRSEVGVGRFIVPLAYQMDDKLTLAGSLDFVWAGMDLQMAMDGASMMDMFPATVNPFATRSGGTLGGTMITTALPAMMPMMDPSHPINWGYFNFSDSSQFTGKAKGTGFAGKIGFTFKPNSQLTVGGTYHSKTTLGNLDATGASVTFNANIDNGILGGGAANGSYTAVPISVPGKISVKNFQWPETYGLGLAYQANDQLMLVADYKRIGWKGVMEGFNMSFTADTLTGMTAGLSGTVMDATLYQNWEDQNVFEIGGAYKLNDALTLRAGLNLANNPVPDRYMNPLFPAIAKNHLTLGVGYAVSKASSVDFDYAYVPKSSATNGQGITVDFAGYSAQFMYSYRY